MAMTMTRRLVQRRGRQKRTGLVYEVHRYLRRSRRRMYARWNGGWWSERTRKVMGKKRDRSTWRNHKRRIVIGSGGLRVGRTTGGNRR